MIKIFGALFLASVAIQIMNYLFVKTGADGAIISHLKIVLITLPIQLIASMAFAYYYSQGVQSGVAYVSLSVYGTSFSIGLASMIQAFIFKDKTLSINEWISLAFAFAAIALVVYEKIKTS